MGISERRSRQKEEVRQAILQSAWQMVKAEGWQALSIRKIADAIEYSVPVVYSHFESKDAILLEFTREGFVLLVQRLEEARKHSSLYCEQLSAMAEAYWNFAFEQSEYYQVMFGLGIPACETVNRVAEIKALSEVMIGVIENAIASGRNPQADKWLKFHTYWSILHGLVSISMMEPDGGTDIGRQHILKDAVAGFVKALVE